MPPYPQTAAFPSSAHAMEMRTGVLAYWREHPESAGVVLKNLDASVLAVEPIVGLITPVYEGYLIEHFRKTGIPLVNTSNFRFADAVASVVSDDREVGRMAGNYLLGRGYGDFVYITFPTAVHSVEREAGFREAVQSANGRITTFSWPGTGGTRIPAGEHQRQLQEIARAVLATGPLTSCRAIFCFSTSCAEELLQVARDLFGESAFRVGWMGVDAPEGKLSQVGHHRLTAVRPNFHQVGYEGAALLAALIRGEAPPPGPVRLPPVEVVEGTTTPGPQQSDALVSTVLAWIETAIEDGDPLEVSALAARARMSARTLQRRFTATLGHGVKKEIYSRRMRRACALLRSNEMSITEISVHIGYSNPGEFSRRFKRTFGQTPREWRASSRRATDPFR
ncbi:MAG: helix-turn-helix domain-containing protein [Opitutales bacterium]|nr:helix-turn-helix domain-containing protein [Opitutales bacterium]